MDGSKEQTMGQFRTKCREAGSRVKQTEPESPWQNAAEGGIREVKRGAGRKMSRKRSPRKLWDHCLELEGYIRSHTALDQYDLQGQIPETIVSGQISDISPFIECEWYEWVKFYDQGASYPKDKEVYGRWLGPAIDIGPAMTAKILKQNGQVFYRSIYRTLIPEELVDETKQKIRNAFDRAITKKLGAVMTEKDLGDLDPEAVTPSHERYSDKSEGTYQSMPDIDDVSPEIQDQYIGAEVNLLVGGEMRAGTVKQMSMTSAGDLYGVSNPNPMLDTRSYDVEFPDGTVLPYTANTIAMNMYSMCDLEGN